MARTSDLQDFNRGTICSQGGLPMAAVVGPGGPSVAATLGPARGTDYGGTIDGMTDQYINTLYTIQSALYTSD